jgi:hypothetical protein
MVEKQFIERGELINRFEENLKYQEDNKHWEVARGTRVAINAIRNLPAADVVEVKHGVWKEHFAYDCWHYDCPFCDFGFAIKIRQEDTPNYCPNCGADMRRIEKR